MTVTEKQLAANRRNATNDGSLDNFGDTETNLGPPKMTIQSHFAPSEAIFKKQQNEAIFKTAETHLENSGQARTPAPHK
jgi:hypothetical protein